MKSYKPITADTELKAGQIIKAKDGKTYKIYAVCDELIWTSPGNDHGVFYQAPTLKNAYKCDGWQLEVEDKRWKPIAGEFYFYVVTGGSPEVAKMKWSDDEIDTMSLAMNNCFPTKEKAEAALKDILEVLKKHSEL